MVNLNSNLAFVGFGSPLLDFAAGQIGPRNIGYVVGGTIGDFGSFTQLTGTTLGTAFQTRQTPDLAKNVSKGLTPFARGSARVRTKAEGASILRIRRGAKCATAF